MVNTLPISIAELDEDSATAEKGSRALDRFVGMGRGSAQHVAASTKLNLLRSQRLEAVSALPEALQNENEPPPKCLAQVLSLYADKLKLGKNYRGPGHGTELFRAIPLEPEKILDAPGVVDDFYLNCMSWSVKDILAVGLGASIYLWNACSGTVTELGSLAGEDPEASTEYVSSLSWIHDGSYLAVGSSDSTVQIWDVARSKRTRMFATHKGRVSSVAWSKHILSSGSADGAIHTHDVRVAKHHISSQAAHSGQVCGLQWSHDGQQLASGSNDNQAHIWEASASLRPLFSFAHNAAVKALSWCPWQASTLVTGGGSRDRALRFWNTSSGICCRSVDTGSQISAVAWAKTYRELISAHGFSSNSLCVWKYPSLALAKEIPAAHDSRILHLAMSPDGERVATVAADENLKIWKVFERAKAAKGGKVSDRPMVTISHMTDTSAKYKGLARDMAWR